MQNKANIPTLLISFGAILIAVTGLTTFRPMKTPTTIMWIISLILVTPPFAYNLYLLIRQRLGSKGWK